MKVQISAREIAKEIKDNPAFLSKILNELVYDFDYNIIGPLIIYNTSARADNFIKKLADEVIINIYR